ncbi:MAG: hypothetical protein Q8O24_03970 [Gallionellaceae bacterium]|nr:hypothetical protein [Gallionellaceae bacterium]
MSNTTQKPATKREYNTKKVNTKEDIKSLGIAKDHPIVRTVTGCVGLKVNIEPVSGWTTFVLHIKDPIPLEL